MEVKAVHSMRAYLFDRINFSLFFPSLPISFSSPFIYILLFGGNKIKVSNPNSLSVCSLAFSCEKKICRCWILRLIMEMGWIGEDGRGRVMMYIAPEVCIDGLGACL